MMKAKWRNANHSTAKDTFVITAASVFSFLFVEKQLINGATVATLENLAVEVSFFGKESYEIFIMAE